MILQSFKKLVFTAYHVSGIMIGNGDIIVSKPPFLTSWNLKSSTRFTSPSKQSYEVCNIILFILQKQKTTQLISVLGLKPRLHVHTMPAILFSILLLQLRNEKFRLHLLSQNIMSFWALVPLGSCTLYLYY